MLPMEPAARKKYIEQAAKAIPGIVRQDTNQPVKTGSEQKKALISAIAKKAYDISSLSQSLPRDEILPGIDSIGDYFKNNPISSDGSGIDFGDSYGGYPIAPAVLGAWYTAKLAQRIKEHNRYKEALKQQQYRTA